MESDITLRPHHLLCLLAFSGEGYSPEFEQEFSRLAKLYRKACTMVQVVLAPDMACQACPHLEDEQCTSPADGPDHRVVALDRAVLQLLGIQPGIHRCGALHARIGALSEEQLNTACSDCSWHPAASCQKIILRKLQAVEDH